MSDPLYGSIEAGGTKFVCAVGRGPEETDTPVTIPTTDPATTMAAVVDFFRAEQTRRGPIAAFGIASFGPADVDPASPGFGTILKTPKPGWSGFDMRGAIAEAFGVPAGFDTDVNGAALAEAQWGAAQGASIAVYVTVGTGIGAGACIDGKAVHGKRHPEMGHMIPRRHPADRDFPGWCPFHGDCLEGLAAGPAVMKRWGKSLSELPPDHIAHTVIADYLGQLAISVIAVLSPEVIVFGGGVLGTPGLLDRIRVAATSLNKGYWADDADIGEIIRAPGLGTASGLCGGFVLARQALQAALTPGAQPVRR
jgi:fructokinase